MIPGLYLIATLIWVIGWCRIASRAGYGALTGLLCIIPVVNVIAFLAFAFGEWPKDRNGVTRT